MRSSMRPAPRSTGTRGARLYGEAQRIIAEEMPIVPIAHAVVTVATTAAVSGFVVDPFGRHSFETVDIAEGE